MPRITKKKPTSAPNAKVPRWVGEELLVVQYTLRVNAWMDGHDPLEDIMDITRAEYMALKTHLAFLRGYDVPEVE